MRSEYPNVVLMAVLTPDHEPQQTYREILVACGIDPDESKNIVIDGHHYDHVVMESDYHQHWQLPAKQGDILVFYTVTYGQFREVIAWDALAKQKDALDAWASRISREHHCRYEIQVTANYDV